MKPFGVEWINPWWRHDMGKRFLHDRSFVTGIHRLPVDSLHKGPIMQIFMLPVLLAWFSCWNNSQVAVDLERHGVHGNVKKPCGSRNVPGKLCQHHTSWCSDSVRRQVAQIYSIDHINCLYTCPAMGRILLTLSLSMRYKKSFLCLVQTARHSLG